MELLNKIVKILIFGLLFGNGDLLGQNHKLLIHKSEDSVLVKAINDINDSCLAIFDCSEIKVLMFRQYNREDCLNCYIVYPMNSFMYRKIDEVIINYDILFVNGVLVFLSKNISEYNYFNKILSSKEQLIEHNFEIESDCVSKYDFSIFLKFDNNRYVWRKLDYISN